MKNQIKMHKNFNISPNLTVFFHLVRKEVDVLADFNLQQRKYYYHCVKSIQIRSFECGDLRRKSPYSVRIRENAHHKKVRI